MRPAEPKTSPPTRPSPSPVSTIERPLIVLDWHHTLSFESDRGSYVPEKGQIHSPKSSVIGLRLGDLQFCQCPGNSVEGSPRGEGFFSLA